MTADSLGLVVDMLPVLMTLVVVGLIIRLLMTLSWERSDAREWDAEARMTALRQVIEREFRQVELEERARRHAREIELVETVTAPNVAARRNDVPNPVGVVDAWNEESEK